MTWLCEHPLIILLTGLTVATVVAAILLQKGQGIAILGTLGVLLVTGGLLVVERLVVTEREEVEQTIYGVARELQANEIEAALSHFAPQAAGLEREATNRLRGVTVDRAKISGLEVQINRLTAPPTAVAKFTGSLHAQYQGQPVLDYVARFTVDLVHDPDGWLIQGYETSRWPTAPDRDRR